MEKFNEEYLATPISPEPAPKPWHLQVSELLAQAATLCVEQGLDVDAFMKGAWHAFVTASPGLREHLEELQLLTQLEELRKLDRIGKA